MDGSNSPNGSDTPEEQDTAAPPVEKTEEEKQQDAEILEHAKTLFTADREHWDEIYDKARNDLDFLSDDEGAQWNEKDYKQRIETGRPALTIDYLSQFIHQVANDIRMNEPAIDVIPDGAGATKETAVIFKGLFKKIAYVSSADEVYDTAATSAVKCSIGYILIDHDYVDDKTHDQQLLIKRVMNPFLIFPDHTSIESDGRDMNHCTILERMKASDFKKEFPNAEITGFDDQETKQGGDVQDSDEITIAHFFIKSTTKSILRTQLKSGTSLVREISNTTIMRYKLSGSEVLSRTVFPGKYIPVVPVYGEEAWKDGKRQIHSLIRKAKQAQMKYNLMQSLETEVLMKQPQAPVMVPAGSIENYAEDWKDPAKSMALRYDVLDAEGNELPPPQRLNPPQLPSGFTQSGLNSINDIKASLGMYNASVGENGPEVSGIAINARKIEGDVATYHFGDNLVRSITQVGRILVSASPVIYDSQRIIQILDDEDETQEVGINGMPMDEQEAVHNFKQGTYDVRVTTGASFTTKRQEAATFFQNIVKSQPNLMNVMGDLLFKNMDFAGADQMAARMRKVMNPAVLAADSDKNDPAVQALQSQLQQAQQMIQKGAQLIQQLETKLKSKDAETQVKAAGIASKHTLEQGKTELNAAGKAGELALKSRELDIEEQKNAAEIALADQGQKIDLLFQMMQRIERSVTPQQPAGMPGGAPANNGGVNIGA